MTFYQRVIKGMKQGELQVTTMGETPKFKYYRRGTGELDTSNFPEIAKAGCVEVHHLDSRTLMALDALNSYSWDNPSADEINVLVTGYVCHMRGDKDVWDPSEAYASLEADGFTFDVRKVQHDSRNGIVTGTVTKSKICNSIETMVATPWFTSFVGADSSVHKFFSHVDVEAKKIRENGKVVSLDLYMGDTSALKQLVIVDDILGGGATIQMCVDKIRESGYKGAIFLWVEWNEGIHSEEFLKQFAGAYIGENIYGVN